MGERTIWKKTLEDGGVQEMHLPRNAELLHVREQNGKICLWYCCNPGNVLELRRVAVVLTGQTVPDDGEYIGTSISQSGRLVYHVFALP